MVYLNLPRIGIHGEEEEGEGLYTRFGMTDSGILRLGDNNEHMIDLELEATVTWIDQWQIIVWIN